ncbi:L-aspartate oxidase [Pseudonocardia xinjiangensis]|uniref:L-aspartate oxidase n=1 Tax=Pseudonocardia xinjiangensis TaxID=75289 RepID=A0ABX1RN99_9PSEU|nr:L-aspartate oxidase [Pseudonocardia xinjiangensis]NMH81354.1 L-aspartate oxidase [Pseudonocardia xinjiangensis]
MSAALWEATADLVVVGSGVAGLTAALDATELGLRVVVVTKDAADAGSTRWAQGGVAVVVGDVPGDTVDAHVTDTLVAGAGLSDAPAVREIIADGPGAVARLRARGAVFDPGGDGRLARAREGGHSAFRVVHAGGDATGAEIERALVTAVSDRRLPLLTAHVAVDVLLDECGSVAGLSVLDDAGRPGLLQAPAVLLATGGYGQLYASSTNPGTATGDGVALALRAGATAADLEFVQFHPTALYTPGVQAGPSIRTQGLQLTSSIRRAPAVGRLPLVTEAVRGEGAVLLDRAGRRFMTAVHPLADLAPRDVVAAAITRTLAETGADCVHLDATAIPHFARRFPTVHAACLAVGVDPVREPIPVTPAAHYACGGVVTDLDGRTTVPGLYAAGEVARTGLHGANRLASNSLLEGLVLGARAARAVAADRPVPRAANAALPVPSPAVAFAPRPVVQRAMTGAAGIGRDAAGLAAASDAVEAATALGVPVDRAGVEDAALTLLAQAVLAAAGHRTESRGCHVRTDFPERDDVWQRTSLVVGLDRSGRPTVQEETAVAA